MKKFFVFALTFLALNAQYVFCQSNSHIFNHLRIGLSVDTAMLNTATKNITADSIWVLDSSYYYLFVDSSGQGLTRKNYYLGKNSKGNPVKSLEIRREYNTEKWVNYHYDSIVYFDNDSSVKEHYGHFWKGDLDKWILTEAQKFNLMGLTTEKIIYSWDDDLHGYTQGLKIEWFYSLTGKLEELMISDLDTANFTWTKHSRVLYYSDDYGYDTLILNQQWRTDVQDWVSIQKDVNEYNPSTKHYICIHYSRPDYFSEWIPGRKEDKHINSANSVDTLVISFWQPDNGSWRKNSRGLYKYNSQNLLMESTGQNYSGLDFSWKNGSHMYHIYNTDNKITEEGHAEWADNDWKYTSKEIWYYENELLQYYIYKSTDNDAGEMSDVERDQYSYDIHRNLTRFDRELNFDGEWVNQGRTEYFWSFFGFEGVYENRIEMPLIYPNPTSGLIYVENPTNTVLSSKVYDLSGRLVKQEILRKGTNTIDLSGENSGTYLLHFSNGRTGKIVIH